MFRVLCVCVLGLCGLLCDCPFACVCVRAVLLPCVIVCVWLFVGVTCWCVCDCVSVCV